MYRNQEAREKLRQRLTNGDDPLFVGAHRDSERTVCMSSMSGLESNSQTTTWMLACCGLLVTFPAAPVLGAVSADLMVVLL